MSKQIPGAARMVSGRLVMGAALAALAIGGVAATLSAAGPTAPYAAPIPPVPARPPVPPVPSAPLAPPEPPAPPEDLVLNDNQLSPAERAELREAAEEARADAREAAQEAQEARREALQAAAEARRDAAEARRDAMVDNIQAQSARTLRAMPVEVRTALITARNAVAGARGMNDEDRRKALSSIDKALSGLDQRRAPTLQ